MLIHSLIINSQDNTLPECKRIEKNRILIIWAMLHDLTQLMGMFSYSYDEKS